MPLFYLLTILGIAYQPLRIRERDVCCFKLPEQAQRFLVIHATVYHLFNLNRCLV